MGNKVEFFAIKEKGVMETLPVWHQGGTGSFKAGAMHSAKLYRSPYMARRAMLTMRSKWDRDTNTTKRVSPSDFEIAKLELRSLAIVKEVVE